MTGSRPAKKPDPVKYAHRQPQQTPECLRFLNRQNELVSYVIEGGVDTEVSIACLDQFSQQLTQRTCVFVDNAPMPRAHDFIQQIPKWVKRGFMIKYLPSYSPALNLIEILWRFIKYTWLPFSAYTSCAFLRRAVTQILKQFGMEYTIDFQTVQNMQEFLDGYLPFSYCLIFKYMRNI